jgi:hypothetical protein
MGISESCICVGQDLFWTGGRGGRGTPQKNQTCSGRETSTYLLLLSQILSFRKGTAKEQNGSVIDPRFLESQPVRVEIRWDRLVIRLRFDRTKRGVESRTRSAPSKVAVPRLGGTARYCQQNAAGAGDKTVRNSKLVDHSNLITHHVSAPAQQHT